MGNENVTEANGKKGGKKKREKCLRCVEAYEKKKELVAYAWA